MESCTMCVQKRFGCACQLMGVVAKKLQTKEGEKEITVVDI